jgi:hypothetical protein
MSSEDTECVPWTKVVQSLEDKLQFGFLEKARQVTRAEIKGSTLVLYVSDPDIAEFFQADVNQQRLMIFSRDVVAIEEIEVTLID